VSGTNCHPCVRAAHRFSNLQNAKVHWAPSAGPRCHWLKSICLDQCSFFNAMRYRAFSITSATSFYGNTYNFGVFVSVWQTAVLVSVAQAKKEVKVRSRQKKSNFQHTDSVPNDSTHNCRQLTIKSSLLKCVSSLLPASCMKTRFSLRNGTTRAFCQHGS